MNEALSFRRMPRSTGWIGVDLDRTLAHYDDWKGETHIGEPIPAMVALVKGLLADGWEVRIFTARVAPGHATNKDGSQRDVAAVELAIMDWCEKHLGRRLAVTCIKDFSLFKLFDDRAIQVEPNTGRLIGYKILPV